MTTIGIIGGSGFYKFFDKGREMSVNTPYGKPSDKIFIGNIADKKVAFLPRHGEKHQFPPHGVPYRANLYALKKLGARFIISITTVGSLKPNIKPGDFVIPDQFVDRTFGRPDTFYPGPLSGEAKNLKFLSVPAKSLKSQENHNHPEGVVHIAAAEPYCPCLREIAIKSCRKNKAGVHSKGTVVVIQGPRFSTKAESRLYSKLADIINMTQYPEVILARELEICYANISIVTDYDAVCFNDSKIKPVTAARIMRIFKENIDRTKDIVFEITRNIPENYSCSCHSALQGAAV